VPQVTHGAEAAYGGQGTLTAWAGRVEDDRGSLCHREQAEEPEPEPDPVSAPSDTRRLKEGLPEGRLAGLPVEAVAGLRALSRRGTPGRTPDT
jgi:hypothetical protein